jgi:ferric-dicitrate binding protein FerR (iron transport regulator)
MENNLLIRFITGQCSETEKEEVTNALLQDESLKKEFIALKNVWSLTRTVEDEGENDYAEEYQRISRKISTNRLKIIFRYAAVITVIFCAGGLLAYQLTKSDFNKLADIDSGLKTRFVVPLGQTAELQLPDGTMVWMNSGSVLSYSSDFNPSNRNVTLDGEAFFSVTKDANHPFNVKTSTVTIKVLGTSFNVEAYSDNAQEVNTTLVSGKVEIDDSNNKKLGELIPGEIARYNKQSGTVKIEKTDTSFYTSWKNGFIMFNNTPLEEISQKMERWYNVKIVFENPKIKSLRYSGTILRGKPIDQILEIMKITADVHYKITVKNNSPNIIYLN